MNSELPKVGAVGGESGQLGRRDCVHMPVIVCYSRAFLAPGQPVRLKAGCQEVYASGDEQRHGIVDPFLPDHTNKDQDFLVFLDPKMITSSVQHTFQIDGFPTQDIYDDGYDECRHCY